MTSDSERFGFSAVRARTWHTAPPDEQGIRRTTHVTLDEPPRWQVCLPHMCDDWQIAPRRGYYGTQAEALAELDRFIAEAQALREKLAAGEEVSP